MNPNDPNYTPFGGITIFFMLCLGGGLILVRHISALLGMPW